MTEAPDLEPLAENIEGHVVESHNYEHRLHHEIPWGHVAVGVGILAAAYVAHQYLNESDESPDEVPDETPAEPSGEFVNVEVGGGGLVG